MTRYRTIVADPPWEYPEGFVTSTYAPHKQDRDRGAKAEGTTRYHLSYPSMTAADIAGIPVSDLADKDARVFLWTTSKHLPAAFAVIPEWGFTYRQMIVWDKTPNFPPFAGGVASIAAEFLLVAARGAPGMLSRWPTSVIRARKPRTTVHSEKPDVFLDVVEAVSPGPYLELFARRQRLGWDTWGNEALEHVEMPA